MNSLSHLMAVFLGLLIAALPLPGEASSANASTSPIDITQINKPLADGFLGPDRMACAGDTIHLEAPLALSYLWSTGATSRSIQIIASASNEYWARITTFQGTTERDTVKITVHPRPSVMVQPEIATLLPGEAVLLIASGAQSYLWSDGHTGSNNFVSPTMPRTIYTVTGTNAFGCSSQAQSVIFVSYTTTPSFTYTKTCIGDSTFFEAKVISNDPIEKIEWDLDGDLEYDDATGIHAAHRFAQPGEWLVGIKVTTLYSEDPYSVYLPVKVGDIPQPDFSVSNGCIDQEVSFEGKAIMAVGEIESWSWNFGNGNTSNEQNPKTTYNQSKSYPVTLNVGSTTGCVARKTKTVVIAPRPSLQITFDDGSPIEKLPLTLYKNETIRLKAGGTFDYVIWNGTVRNEFFNITVQGTYSAVAYYRGCTSLPVKLGVVKSEFPYDPSLVISNILTPNGDGYNDTWIVPMLNSLKPVKVTIYSRSGLQVFHSDDYKNDWKGEYNNNPLPEGSYFYIVEGAGGEIFKGSITLLR